VGKLATLAVSGRVRELQMFSVGVNLERDQMPDWMIQ